MVIKRFEDILAWQKAGKLILDIYQAFHNCRDYNFINQIQRAAVSIMNNIAEGFERRTNKDFKNFLFISKGSCGEVRSMLYLAVKLNYISEKEFNDLRRTSLEVSRLISGFIKTL